MVVEVVVIDILSLDTYKQKLRKNLRGVGMKTEEEKAVWKKLAYTIWRVRESEQGTDLSGCVRTKTGWRAGETKKQKTQGSKSRHEMAK